MEKRIEREWKWVLCPEEREKTPVMYEWDLLCERGKILKRTLRPIDCFHPKLTEFGRGDCHWLCEGVVRKRER